MKEEDTPQSEQTAPLAVDLTPFHKDGPDALAIHDTPQIASAKLVAIRYRLHNTSFGILIRFAEDIFAPGPFLPKLLDPTAKEISKITGAVLQLELHDSPRPITVALSRTKGLSPAALPNASIILRWFRKRHLLILAAFLLSLATAISATLADGDADEDDPLTDRQTALARA
jgi:hypothetical protein